MLISKHFRTILPILFVKTLYGFLPSHMAIVNPNTGLIEKMKLADNNSMSKKITRRCTGVSRFDYQHKPGHFRSLRGSAS